MGKLGSVSVGIGSEMRGSLIAKSISMLNDGILGSDGSVRLGIGSAMLGSFSPGSSISMLNDGMRGRDGRLSDGIGRLMVGSRNEQGRTTVRRTRPAQRVAAS